MTPGSITAIPFPFLGGKDLPPITLKYLSFRGSGNRRTELSPANLWRGVGNSLPFSGQFGYQPEVFVRSSRLDLDHNT
jgi:hypothetical protein